MDNSPPTAEHDTMILRLAGLLEGPEGVLARTRVDYEVLPDGCLQVRWPGPYSATRVCRELEEQFGDEVTQDGVWFPLRVDVKIGDLRVRLNPRDLGLYWARGEHGNLA